MGKRGRCGPGLSGLALLLVVLFATPASAQSLSRFSFDSTVSVDVFRGDNAVDRPNIIVDITGQVRLGDGWVAYVRPWFRQPRTTTWDNQIYQAALQYERSGPVSTRLDLGYIVSPVGIGMMDTRPGVNPTIVPHLSYLVPMPAFDPGGPRISPIAATYPLGGALTLSTNKWDVRGALVSSAPTRVYVINGATNPRATPVVEAGAGITPTIGLRFGVSFAHGQYATSHEITGASSSLNRGRQLTMVNLEGEYAFAHTKVNGEITRDALETATGDERAYQWFVQGMQTLTPRWFAAARQEGASAPPLRSGTAPTARRLFHTTETTVGFRISPDLTLRGSYSLRKSYTTTVWDRQVGMSVVWSRRWW